jgi:hypothetical protein
VPFLIAPNNGSNSKQPNNHGTAKIFFSKPLKLFWGGWRVAEFRVRHKVFNCRKAVTKQAASLSLEASLLSTCKLFNKWEDLDKKAALFPNQKNQPKEPTGDGSMV